MNQDTVYLAARYSRREELCRYRDHLHAMGWEVTSRWLNGEHQISDAGLAALGPTSEALVEGEDNQSEDAIALRTRFAVEDWADVKKAAVVVSFTEQPRSSASRGGRHVEFGAALAQGKTCLVVGPRENVFHCMPDVQVYAEWPHALAELDRILVAGTKCAVGGGVVNPIARMLRPHQRAQARSALLASIRSAPDEETRDEAVQQAVRQGLDLEDALTERARWEPPLNTPAALAWLMEGRPTGTGNREHNPRAVAIRPNDGWRGR